MPQCSSVWCSFPPKMRINETSEVFLHVFLFWEADKVKPLAQAKSWFLTQHPLVSLQASCKIFLFFFFTCTVIWLVFYLYTWTVKFLPHTRTRQSIRVQLCVSSKRSERGEAAGIGGLGRTWKREHHYSDTQLFALSAVWVMRLRAGAKYSECFETKRNSKVAVVMLAFHFRVKDATCFYNQ